MQERPLGDFDTVVADNLTIIPMPANAQQVGAKHAAANGHQML